ncbi:MAG: serine hydrolase [Chitinophagaceae bacterium]
MRNYSLVCMIFLLPVVTIAQQKKDPLLENILGAEPDSLMQAVLSQPEVYKYQIIYTQINRDKNNIPSFKNYYYNVDRNRYFNPASTVKMPLAFLSLEKFNTIKKPGVNKYTAMQFDSSWSAQTKAYTDSTAENNLPSIAQYIRKAFLVSDNDAYNRMYEFVGQQTINRRLHAMGYPDARITRRFMRMLPEENRRTNPIRFIKQNGTLIYRQPMASNKDSFDFSHIYKMGNTHYNADDSLINEPIDFTTANNLPLEDMQQLLKSVMFPNSVASKQQFNFTKDDYTFLYRYLSQYPSETNFPKYDTGVYYDSYVKFFFREGCHKMPEGVRVFNKVGWAYGCLTDVSYVADFKTKVEFMLAITIYVNADGVMNDNKYEYTTVGWPFFYKAGQTIYRYELKRNRHHPPNLARFKLDYKPRKEDGKPVIKDADN